MIPPSNRSNASYFKVKPTDLQSVGQQIERFLREANRRYFSFPYCSAVSISQTLPPALRNAELQSLPALQIERS